MTHTYSHVYVCCVFTTIKQAINLLFPLFNFWSNKFMDVKFLIMKYKLIPEINRVLPLKKSYPVWRD